MDCSTPGFNIRLCLPEFAQTHIHWVSDVIQSFHALSLPSPPSLSLSSIRSFSNESALCIRWPKYWSFSFTISLSNDYSGLISFRSDWFDLLAVQGTLKSLLQLHSWKASVLHHSAFFMVQLSQPFLNIWKIKALTIRIFVSKVMSLLFNMLSRFVIAFLPRSKSLLISWLQSQSTVILELKKIKSATISIFPPSICHKVVRQDAMILFFWMLSFKPAFSLSSSTFIQNPTLRCPYTTCVNWHHN